MVKPLIRTHEPLTDVVCAELGAYNPLMRQLLGNRGLITRDKAESFLNPNYDTDLRDPFLLTDMEKAVLRILYAVENDEHIVIYSDYDCDGIPGGVILHDLFVAIGFLNFENYIPHRHHEGYGFNPRAVELFIERNAKLIITVDCGIVDFEATVRAHELGIDVIITDHHEPSDTLPPAYAIVNPKRDNSYPFQGICGAAVAYKLAQAILIRGKEKGVVTLKDGLEKWWLDLVCIATIADMMPLQDESRVLAKYGLQVLRKTKRPGIQHLLRKAGGSQRHLTEDDIGFTIAPRINAASRMDTPEDAFHMLRTKEESEAGAYVDHLEKLNNERKGVVAGMTKEAKHRLRDFVQIPPLIVMGNPEWRPSLVGLVATSLVEEFGRPAFLWGRDGQGVIKGSCRSDGKVSVVRIMEGAREHLLGFGGHHASGGFSVSHENIHSLGEVLTQAYEAEKHEECGHVPYTIDASITIEDIDDTLLRNLDLLAPFGMGNPKPLFHIQNIRPLRVDVFGKAHDHTKLQFKTSHGFINAIAFFRLPETFSMTPHEGEEISLLAHVERSFFMGREETRLRIVEIM